MKSREKIEKMPVWQAFLIVIMLVGFMIMMMEHYVINKAFSLMNHVVSKMEKTFKEDDQELLNDYKEFDERQAYDRAQSELISFDMKYGLHASEVKQPYYCEYVIKNKKIEKLYDLPYAKHHAWVHESISKSIAWNKKMIEEGSKKYKFDPTQCKDPTV